MAKVKRIKEELQPGTLPESAEKILEELEGESQTKVDLYDNLNYSRTVIDRQISFLNAQGVLQKNGREFREEGRRPKIYEITSEYGNA